MVAAKFRILILRTIGFRVDINSGKDLFGHLLAALRAPWMAQSSSGDQAQSAARIRIVGARSTLFFRWRRVCCRSGIPVITPDLNSIKVLT